LQVIRKVIRTASWFWARHRLLAVFSVLSLLIVLFVLVPLFKIVFLSNKAALWQAIQDTSVLKSILLTLFAALITTVIGFLLGVPLAFILARHNFPLKGVLEGLIDLPIVVPHTAAGIALLFVFGRNYLLGKWFNSIGVQFVDSLAGIIIGMLFVSVPFLINAAKDGFRKVDVRLENVARTLGASPWQAFRRVIILTYFPMVTSILIYQRFESYGLTQAIPVAAILVIICAIIFIGFRFFLQREKKRD
jgi:molybdate/tungstate transport system permease protein